MQFDSFYDNAMILIDTQCAQSCHKLLVKILQISGGDEGGNEVRQSRRMSLRDWLASNAIPDSNALNKAYLRSLRRRKRTPVFSCHAGEFFLPFEPSDAQRNTQTIQFF